MSLNNLINKSRYIDKINYIANYIYIRIVTKPCW